MGVHCWVLHPVHGMKPVAEGIAGGAPPARSVGASICRSLLMELCEEGQQTVKVTKLHKKYTDVMYPQGNASSMYLDEYVVPPAPPNTYITWSTVYLVEKSEEPS